MRLRVIRWLAVATLFGLVGCAGVGIVATSNPDIKISDARSLYGDQNRPLPAERLIREAIAIYEEQNNQSGLGNAYNVYGWFFESESVAYWEKVYRRDGFLDSSASYDTRYEDALRHFRKAEALQESSHTYDGLSNTYLGVGIVNSYHLKNHIAACAAYEKSLEANRKNIAENPNAKVQVWGGHSSFAEAVKPLKKQAGCE